jgi:hypothetical protein
MKASQNKKVEMHFNARGILAHGGDRGKTDRARKLIVHKTRKATSNWGHFG